MTTNIKIEFCLDVSKENEVYNFQKVMLPPEYVIAGISWSKDYRDRKRVRSDILKYVVSFLNDKLSDISLWFFSGNSVWQNDNRIVRYRGLWGGLKAQGVLTDQFNELHEELVDCDGKLKFFGATKISDQSIESVIETSAIERSSYVMMLPRNIAVREILCNGWSSDYTFDKKLIGYVFENSGLIIKAVGDFDDPETGFVGLASPDLIKKIVYN